MTKLSLTWKVVCLLMLFTLAGFVIGGIGLTKMAELNRKMSDMTEKVTPRMLLAKEAELNLVKMGINILYMVQAEKPEDVNSFYTKVEGSHQAIQQKSSQYLSLATDSEKELFAGFTKYIGEYAKGAADVKELLLQGKRTETSPLITQMREKRMAAQKLIDQIIAKNTEAMEQSVSEEAQAFDRARLQMIAAGFVIFSLGGLLAFVLLRSLSRQLDRAIGKLNASTQQVTVEAQQIAASSQALAQATTEQAASLQQTVSTIEEMTSMIKKNTDHAENSAQLAVTSETSAQRGRAVVEKMIQAIREIDDSNEQVMKQITESNDQLTEIVKVIQEIGNKTNVINDIVFQTKLLAFNASVEAARAGDAGKGFAVVAEEVGKLAQMSGSAASDIGGMLETSIKRVEQVVTETRARVETLMSTGRQKVSEGTIVAQECGTVLEEIVRNISSVTEMGKAISSASQEQARGANEVSIAMTQLNQVTQANSANTEATATSSRELATQATTLKEVVHELTEIIEGRVAAQVEHRQQKSSMVPAPAVRGAVEVSAAHVKGAAPSAALPSEDDPRFADI